MKIDSQSRSIYLAVGFGGMVGAVGRYGISSLTPVEIGFPYGTLTANLIGCFLLSFILGQPAIKEKIAPHLFAAITTGVIGSFTTFSTFMVETVNLYNSTIVLALGYVFLSIVGGLLFCYTGFWVANRRCVDS
ncbi:fluoride efflux transporter CrcB [Virgibacillus sp. DJP39]|uniref:fluoride efflux transporter CrcB n=1 Tax=Virgibacillus sp. DJP39 TaxID=3409790 RepID=UPI003BB52F71